MMMACDSDRPTAEASISTAETVEFSMSADINMPQFVDLEEGSLRSHQYTYTNSTGHPRISFIQPGQTSTNITRPTDQGTGLAVNLRWRPISKTTPETPITGVEMNGITMTHGSPSYGGKSTIIRVNKTAEGGERLTVYYSDGAKGNATQGGWWGLENQDMYFILSYGLQVGKAPLDYRQERIKFYYYSGVVPSGNNPAEIEVMSARNVASTHQHTRKLVFSTPSQPNPNTLYPMLTRPRLGVRIKTLTGTATNGTFAYAKIDDRTLDARGTILALGFTNQTGEDITILDLEAKNDGLAYNGYFSMAPKQQVGAADRDGVAPEAVMTAAEVKAGAPLKFVETSDVGFSQYTLDNITVSGERPILTYYSFGVYANPSATAKGLTLANGATTSNETLGRVFLWGYPKNGGSTPVTVRVKYRNANGVEVFSRPQTITPPAGGFQETVAYLKTIRVVPEP